MWLFYLEYSSLFQDWRTLSSLCRPMPNGKAPAFGALQLAAKMSDERKDSPSSSSEKDAKKAKASTQGDGGAGPSSNGNSDEDLIYDPVHFIRSHSKNNDPTDIQTQIWEVVFEPDPEDASRTTSRVATCGGNIICIIDVISGQVIMKYKHQEIKENFYALAWTTLKLGGKQSNVLVSGGIRGEVRMFHPKSSVCFHKWCPVEKKGCAVNSLVFHSERATWLFCGTGDGVITLWDIGCPVLPTYDGISPKKLLRVFPAHGDVYNIAWTGDNGWLLAGTATGLVGFNIDDDRVQRVVEGSAKEYKPAMVNFILPESKRGEGRKPVVDSLAVASKWTVVSKCALHGLIYVWDLKATVDEATKGNEDNPVIKQKVKMLAKLRWWSDTDNFHMNLGCHKGTGLIACGDDKGSLWLYNLPQFGRDGSPAVSGVVEPTVRLMWPELQDDQLENSRKVPLDKHIIVKVQVSHDNSHVVAVTSNNMVCVWRRLSGGREDDVASSGDSGGPSDT